MKSLKSYLHNRIATKELVELYIPPNDVRRTYMKIFENAFNSADQDNIYAALKSICSTDEDEIILSVSVGATWDSLLQPMYQEIQSLDAISRYMFIRLDASPDIVTSFQRPKYYFNNRTQCSEIYFEYHITGTITVEMVMSNIQSPSDLSSAVFGLSELGSGSKSSKEIDTSSGKQEDEEETSDLPEKKKQRIEDLSLPETIEDQSHRDSSSDASNTTVVVSVGYMRFLMNANEKHDIPNIIIANKQSEFRLGNPLPEDRLDAKGIFIMELDKQRKVHKIKGIRLQ